MLESTYTDESAVDPKILFLAPTFYKGLNQTLLQFSFFSPIEQCNRNQGKSSCTETRPRLPCLIEDKKMFEFELELMVMNVPIPFNNFAKCDIFSGITKKQIF